jgi:hypothetical protein
VLEGPGLRLTGRQALTRLGGLGAAMLGATGCAARDPARHALATAATPRAAHRPGTLLWHVRAPWRDHQPGRKHLGACAL